MVLRGLVRTTIVVLAPALVSAQTADAQTGPFSLEITFRDAGPTPAPDRIYSDGDSYRDLSDAGGRTPEVYGEGGIVLDLRGSDRTLCLNFDGAALPGPDPTPSLRPRTTCAPVLMRVLGPSQIEGQPTPPPVTEADCGSSWKYSVNAYWTGADQDGAAHTYNVAFGREAGNAVDVTVTCPLGQDWPKTWTFSTPWPATAIVSVYLTGKGKNGGWNDVGEYDMPFGMTATPLDENLRVRGKKK